MTALTAQTGPHKAAADTLSALALHSRISINKTAAPTSSAVFEACRYDKVE